MIAVMTTRPAIAVAARSIWRKRSSFPSPRSPRIVSLRPPKRITAANAAMTSSAYTAPLRSPPIHSAAKSSAPSTRANTGWKHFDLLICIEHFLHLDVEESGQREREWQGRGVLLRLDRVDRLSRHAHRTREFCLRQFPLEPPRPDVVPHGCCQASLTHSRCQARFTLPVTTRLPNGHHLGSPLPFADGHYGVAGWQRC